MNEIWSPHYRIYVERCLWVLVMQLQAAEGVAIPPEAIEDYQINGLNTPYDLARIAEIEFRTRHDLQARLEYFNEQVGHRYAHWGLTSCDVTENVSQTQIQAALHHVQFQTRRVLSLFESHIEATRDVLCVARTHNQPAQATLLGKRFASFADEILCGLGALQFARESQPCRGLSGAVGTGQDLISLLGSHEAYERVNAGFIEALGFKCRKVSGGQIYARSEDLQWVTSLQQVASGCINLARMVRLESAYPRMWESFDDGQVGSSAMPHKRNPIISERICGLGVVLYGYQTMLESLAGQQWYEGDVSDSVTRRIALSGIFQTVDAILENTARLLQDLDLSKDAYEAEFEDYRRALKTGELMSAALRNGANRDEAYRAIQDERYPPPGLTSEQVEQIIMAPVVLTEAALQIDEILALIKEVSNGALRKVD
jgi:adenylosuccinate lyase